MWDLIANIIGSTLIVANIENAESNLIAGVQATTLFELRSISVFTEAVENNSLVSTEINKISAIN